MAVIAGEGWTLEVVPLDLQDKWFLPVIARRESFELRLLALWVKPAEDYLGPTVRALEKCTEFLSQGFAIVAGDFNANILWDRAGRKRRFAQILESFAALKLVSAWHGFSAERHGQESVATYYHLRSSARPFHIDYAFVPDAQKCTIEKVEIGTYEEWVTTRLSDHVPLIAELALLGGKGV